MAAFLAGRALRRGLAIKKMKKLEATSKKTAKTPQELGISKWTLEDLTKSEGVKQTNDGRYYLPCKDGKHC